MITILCDFRQFLGEKNGVFIKNQCYYQIFGKKLAAVCAKNAILLPNFLAKIFLKL
jgi:hypothetical protein